MKWKWFRRKPKQTPEEAYVKALNEAAERRESQQPCPYITPRFFEADHAFTGYSITADQIHADNIYENTITVDKIDLPVLWKHDHTKPIVTEQGRING